jgi:aldose sugar dehydrogenase
MLRTVFVCSVFVLAPAAAAQTAFQSDVTRFMTAEVAAGLKQPVAMTFLPDGRALLVQRQSSQLGLLDHSGKIAFVEFNTSIENAAQPAAILTGEDAGLLDIALHPNYAQTGWIYLSYSAGERERSTTAIDRFRLRDDRVIDRQRIFTAQAYSEDRFHYGGRMAFANDRLYVSVGDRHHQDRAQELGNHAGKILRLMDDGSAPPDNPFAGREGALPEIWSYGHRNPQGLVLLPKNGELWEHEHGPRHGDELNLIRKGANYGWPAISYGWQYSGGPIGMGITVQEGLEQPVWVWTPAIAPSGMVFYSGAAFPKWQGNILIGSMAQHCLDRLVLRDGRVVVDERVQVPQAGRVRLVAQGPEGNVYIGNDDGKLLRLMPAR